MAAEASTSRYDTMTLLHFFFYSHRFFIVTSIYIINFIYIKIYIKYI